MRNVDDVGAASFGKNILVIGAGTGLTTAYMLENMPGFRVTVVDANNRLGGHINSLYHYRRTTSAGILESVVSEFDEFQKDIFQNKVVQEPENTGYAVEIRLSNGQRCTIRILGEFEGGAEFIGSSDAYPNVHKLFDTLNVSLKGFELNADFHRVDQKISPDKRHLLLPPIYDRRPKVGFFCCTTADTIDLQLTDIKYLHGIYEAINEAKRQAAPDDDLINMMTLEQFVRHLRNRLRNNLLPQLTGLNVDDFASRVLYPMLAAAWGVPISQIKQFCAHYAMNYLSLGKGWFDANNGLSTYIAELSRRSNHLDVHLNTKVQAIRPVVIENSLKYKVFLGKDNNGNDQFLMDKNGKIALFDEVINTASAERSVNMLPRNFPDNIPGAQAFEADMADLHAKLAAVRYYDTAVVFHLDEKYKTHKGTVIHTRIETLDGEEYAANTACKEKLGKGSVMKTWVLAGQPMPAANCILATRHYRHPVQDNHYFIAQQKIHEMARKQSDTFGYRFGGILAQLGDSHEDGIVIALKNALALCEKYHCTANNARLAPFVKPVGNHFELLYFDNNQLSTQTIKEVEAVDAGCCCVVQ